MSVWSHFLAAAGGYMLRAYNDERRATRANQVCFIREDPESLPDELAAQAEEILARGAQMFVNRVGDVVEIAFTDEDTGELIEILRTTSQAATSEQTYVDGDTIDVTEE